MSSNKFALVDEEDFDRVKEFLWNTHSGGYVLAVIDGARIYMHRLILQSPLKIDHINGDRRDNRKRNLRIATNSQNGANSKLRKNNTSGYKGVWFNKRLGRWGAKIMVNYKNIHLGYEDTPETAFELYKTAAAKYFGEFANDGTK